MTKEDVAAALLEYGQLLELKGEPSFRTLSYQTAARASQARSWPRAVWNPGSGRPAERPDRRPSQRCLRPQP